MTPEGEKPLAAYPMRPRSCTVVRRPGTHTVNFAIYIASFTRYS